MMVQAATVLLFFNPYLVILGGVNSHAQPSPAQPSPAQPSGS
jgi:hypothetical protein